MDGVEQDLRDEFARRVTAAPALPHLADTALRAGRRARRRRTALTTAAGAAVVAIALGAAAVLPAFEDRRADVASAPLQGPPRVPLFIGQGNGELVDWPGGRSRARPLGEATPVAQVPDGLLVVVGQPPALALLGPDEDRPRVLVRDLAGSGVAVADDGARATVVTGAGGARLLTEVQLPSGRVLRSIALTPLLRGEGESAHPVAYSASAVLVALGEGPDQRVALWEGGHDQVLSALDGWSSVLGGAPLDDGVRDAVGGRAAVTVPGQCRTRIVQLRNGDGDPWELCRETFAGFSPDGEAVLATNALSDGLVVHDADDGEQLHSFDVPEGLRAYGWESADTVLYTTVDGARTVVVRCSTRSGACARAAEFPFTDRIPQPVRRAG